MTLLSPHQLANQKNKTDFVNIFSGLYEHSPWVVMACYETVKTQPCFDNISVFYQLLSETMLAGDEKLKTALIQAHPVLGMKKKRLETLTKSSQQEQKSIGLDVCTAAELMQFDNLNQQYFARFQMPFIMAVGMIKSGERAKKQTIIAAMQIRLNNSAETERSNALSEINKIAWLRLEKCYE